MSTEIHRWRATGQRKCAKRAFERDARHRRAKWSWEHAEGKLRGAGVGEQVNRGLQEIPWWIIFVQEKRHGMADTSERAEAKPKKKLSEFLESAPPDVVEDISDLCELNGFWVIARPDLQLHCSSEVCEGLRFFRCISDQISMGPKKVWAKGFMSYVCRNCQRTLKTYALMALHESGETFGVAVKLGEVPPFGPPVPSKVISLIGPDRDLFLRGRRAENHGLGIGAFAYYRRVVENQKGRIITEIGKVAQKLGARAAVLTQFENAAKETQFSKAIGEVKAAIPDGLLIGGQNPLTLLHSALSEGIHAQTDEECLQLAQDIRIVLTELADRISQALKDEAELKQAVNRLLNRRTGDSSGDASGEQKGVPETV